MKGRFTCYWFHALFDQAGNSRPSRTNAEAFAKLFESSFCPLRLDFYSSIRQVFRKARDAKLDCSVLSEPAVAYALYVAMGEDADAGQGLTDGRFDWWG